MAAAKSSTRQRSGKKRKASEKTEKYQVARNVDGEGTVAEHVYEAYAQTDPDEAGGEPDVLLDVPVLKVDRIHLAVEDLKAHVSLRAQVLDLVKLNVGVQVELGKVKLDIEGVEAQALVKVRLDHVVAVVDRVLTTIDRNPELLESVGQAVEDVGSGAGDALGETGEAVEDVGSGAGDAVEGIGSGVERGGGSIGRGAGRTVKQVGQGAAGAAAGGAGGGGAGGVGSKLQQAALKAKGADADASDHGARAALVAKEATKTVAKELGSAASQAVKEVGERRKHRRADKQHATDAAVKLADELDVDLDEVEGSGKDDRVTVHDVRAAAEDQ
jgi:pyruvate/2-oxoglutarate dehydrogenase complex dihydrolipoamide acyltransferase (E2) component